MESQDGGREAGTVIAGRLDDVTTDELVAEIQRRYVTTVVLVDAEARRVGDPRDAHHWLSGDYDTQLGMLVRTASRFVLQPVINILRKVVANDEDSGD